MPLTFFAHQAPVLPLKLLRPRWFDGTALCLGAAAPDLAYPLGGWIAAESHTVLGVLTWSLAWTLVACRLVRRWVAPTAFAQLPDLGPMRLHSLRVLAQRRPPVWQTVTSALTGAASHVVVDAFTHRDRFGANWLGLNGEVFTVHGRVFTSARILQYLGHTAGSLVGVALLAHMGRRRRLEEWYGDTMVADARSFVLRPHSRVWFWAVVATGVPAGALWASTTTESVIFTVIDTTIAALLVASLLPICRAAEEGDFDGRPRRRATDRASAA
jgi:hypothetical protein